jgi:hypothetical protein
VGRHSFGATTTRRSLANRPDGPFTHTFAVRPGELVQIDSTPLDVMPGLTQPSPHSPERTVRGLAGAGEREHDLLVHPPGRR